jgi:phosphotransferase system  glucose/maltose/N-acetylglucosamine-specific IIC component
LGRVLLGRPPGELRIKSLEWLTLKKHAGSLILGSSVIGFLLAIAAYFICYWLIVRFREKDEALEELTREMEETGESLDE